MANIITSIEFSSAVIGALAGAVIGGFFTWLAAWYTMRQQRKLDDEQRRLDRMPLLRIEMKYVRPEEYDFSVLGVMDGELLTTANPEANVLYSFLCVSSTVAGAFNFRVDEVYMEPHGVLEKSEFFAPLQIQLLQDEEAMILFNCLDSLNCNVDVVIRFQYEDIFGNLYFQDVAFQYYEVEYDQIKREVLEKREVFQPQLGRTKDGKWIKIRSLEECVSRMRE